MKVLFISYFDGDLKTGGGVCSNRNIESLRKIYGSKNVILFTIKRDSRKSNESLIYWNIKNCIIDIFELGFAGLNSENKKKISEIIHKNQIKNIFLDSSLFGILSKIIKELFPEVYVSVFFHNSEYSFLKQSIFLSKKYWFLYRILIAYISERLVCKYADKIIVLNKRDENEILSNFNRKADLIIPVSLFDTYKSISNKTISEKKIGLFVGSYFPMNVHGINWFISNVLPYVNMKLIIVGKDMNKLRVASNLLGMEVEIHSSVPNLTVFYERADFVILPVFYGGGMKIKTAEALMHGKFLIGTKEAFEGYEIEENVGLICDSSSEVITAINGFNKSFKFNFYSKELFLEKNSFESTLPLFMSIFKSE